MGARGFFEIELSGGDGARAFEECELGIAASLRHPDASTPARTACLHFTSETHFR